MTTSVCTTSAAGYSARRRLLVAHVALILGWLTLAVSLFMNMGTVTVGWNHKSYSTWAIISWFFRPPYWGGMLLFAPLFIGLAAGTLATAAPARSAAPCLIWLCRIGAVGVCEGLPLGLLYLVACFRISPSASDGNGIGTLFFATGSLLIGLSAWIRPAGASKSDSGTSRQRAEPP
jgi:hypothetical protein